MRKYLLPSCSLICLLVFSVSPVYSQCEPNSGLEVRLSVPAEFCLDAGQLTGLSGGFPSGGVYSGPGVIDDGNGETYSFDPAIPGIGVHTLRYTVEIYLDGHSLDKK